MPSTRRTLAVLTAVLATALGATATAHAGIRPVLDVRVGQQSIDIAGADGLVDGGITLALRRDAGEPRTIAVVELARGVTKDDVDALALGGLTDVTELERLGRLVGGITVEAGTRERLTFKARARRHVIVDVSHEAEPSAEFLVADGEDGGRLPVADAKLDVLDDRFRLNALPTRGRLRVRNLGEDAHHVLAIRLGAGVTYAAARRALLAGRSPEQVGRPVELMGLLSGGATAWVNHTLGRGRYVVVSFQEQEGGRRDLDLGLIGATRVV